MKLWDKMFTLEGDWKYVNLDSHAEMLPLYQGRNRLLDPMFQEFWLDKLKQQLGAKYLWGGYLENRKHLWKGSYIQPDHFWHVGLDFWVPAGTEVKAGVYANLLHVENDEDVDLGWGGKLIFKVHGGFMILGHLQNMVTQKRDYNANETVGVVGNYPLNGNYAPHLHVQICKTFDPKVDAYSKWHDNIREDFPNPLMLERLA